MPESNLAHKLDVDNFDKEQFILDEKIAAQNNPFIIIREGRLKIKTKERGLIPFEPNDIQLKLLDMIENAWKEDKPIKVIIPKPRQTGISTLTEAIIFVITSQQPNTNAFTMADILKHTNNMFNMFKIYEEELRKDEGWILPPLKHSNEKKLEFQETHSLIDVHTSENIDSARSGTYQLAHLSEAATFKDLKAVLDGLQMPKTSFSMLVIESTGRGLGNEFEKLCRLASKGLIDYKLFFISTADHKEYAMPLFNGKLYSIEAVEFDTDGGIHDFIKEEIRIKEKYKLSMEQLNWRRYTIVNDCSRSVRTFRQEYPYELRECFQFTGACVFDQVKLKAQREKNIKPKRRGRIVEMAGKVSFVDDPNGWWFLYREPQRWMKCVIGADASEGIEKDYSGAIIQDRSSTGEIYAVYHTNKHAPDEMAVEMRKAGILYNWALVGAETFPSAHGATMMQALAKIYRNVYVHMREDELTKKKTKRLGWHNTNKTRTEAIEIFKMEIREHEYDLRHEELINECFTFIKHPDRRTGSGGYVLGKMAAEIGSHDDLVVAKIVTGKLRQLYPYVYRKHKDPDYLPRKKKEPDNIGLDNLS